MREWWRDAVIYQIYPRSFQDDSGDGIGDLKGIIRRLDHVASLGVDAIWLSPFFTSPDLDMGYDVSDYKGVSPLFGDINDFDALVEKAHDLGLKVIIDQVLSHTSDQHPWFQESRQNRTNDKADWYVWADPKKDGTPPNNWLSIFGGSGWQFDTRRHQYYLHNFLTEQPDLNFHNPAVVDALLDAMKFWLERGVDGFRLDTVNFYVHDANLTDNPPSDWEVFPNNPYEAQDQEFSKSRPENLEVLKRLRDLTDQYPDRMMVGECGEMGDKQVRIMGEYTSGGDKLHMAYSFAMLSPEHTAEHFRHTIEVFQETAPDGWPCWSFSNHDVARHVSRWTPKGADPAAVARQSIAMLCSFPGTLNIYQGEEIGQTQTDILWEELQDTANAQFWPEYKGRDGCRTPMVWEKDAPQGGFSTSDKPWLPVKAPQLARAVDTQEDDTNSILNAYRRTLAFRKSRHELRYGKTEFLDLPEPLLGVIRAEEDSAITGIFNLSNEPQRVVLKKELRPVGPMVGAVEGPVPGKSGKSDDCVVDLPPFGFVYLDGKAEI
ncbi:alpha-amylase family glycosyl hydrolase [Marivivens aquimaris]|uniref:alpha-amylase family glycosyl hydrolase n=1 Tax=Marivivens aquimaris TaxID=2774876 RepID=UPI00188229F9|nr:alpha-amylase family glycosyl hydrolase [Marivivens aquimaris]